jgi:hypothetical protein
MKDLDLTRDQHLMSIRTNGEEVDSLKQRNAVGVIKEKR